MANLWKAFVTFALVGCGLTNSGGFKPDVVTQSGALTSQTAFEKALYPLVRTKCADCHGSGTGPQFAVADVAASHTVALNYANLAAPVTSTFVTRTKDHHCGFNCSTDGSEMTNAITQWNWLMNPGR